MTSWLSCLAIRLQRPVPWLSPALRSELWPRTLPVCLFAALQLTVFVFLFCSPATGRWTEPRAVRAAPVASLRSPTRRSARRANRGRFVRTPTARSAWTRGAQSCRSLVLRCCLIGQVTVVGGMTACSPCPARYVATTDGAQCRVCQVSACRLPLVLPAFFSSSRSHAASVVVLSQTGRHVHAVCGPRVVPAVPAERRTR